MSASQATSPARSRSRHRAGVFLCDDAADFRRLLRLALEEDPLLAIVGEAGDGATCVAAVARANPDVVVIDLSMPGQDGLWAIPRVRDRLPGCAIVVVSAQSEAEMGARARAAGANAYVEKGQPLERIASAVRSAVGSRDAADRRRDRVVGGADEVAWRQTEA